MYPTKLNVAIAITTYSLFYSFQSIVTYLVLVVISETIGPQKVSNLLERPASVQMQIQPVACPGVADGLEGSSVGKGWSSGVLEDVVTAREKRLVPVFECGE
jgi:hypothetical protein